MWHCSLWWSCSWHSVNIQPASLASPAWACSCWAMWFGSISLSTCPASGFIRFWKCWICRSASRSSRLLAYFASVSTSSAKSWTTPSGPKKSKPPRSKSEHTHTSHRFRSNDGEPRRTNRRYRFDLYTTIVAISWLKQTSKKNAKKKNQNHCYQNTTQNAI